MSNNPRPLQNDELVLDPDSLQTYVLSLPRKTRQIFEKIVHQKEKDERPLPSAKCILGTSRISQHIRLAILDLIALTVDENFWGRHEMCVYFAILLRDALSTFGHSAQAVLGSATYHSPVDRKKDFTWEHAWVVLDNEIIDGNIDSLIENPHVDPQSRIAPSSFWGLQNEVPHDRTLVLREVISMEYEKRNTTVEKLEQWRSSVLEKLQTNIDKWGNAA